MKRPTITDVAARAGVSKSTVSHALSSKRPISAATRHRIMAAIDELGYRPHPVAQRLAGGEPTRTIGFVFPLYATTIAGLEMQFITGAANVINQADFAFLLLTHPEHNPDHLQRFVQSGLVDGFILMQVRLTDPRVDLLRQADVPFVLVGRCADNTGLHYIDLDVDRAITDCVDYLAELGHRSIAYLHQDVPDFSFVQRARHSFDRACRARQLDGVAQPCQLSVESGKKACEAVLARHPDTTAVIVWNDSAAWGVVQAIEARGHTIPADLSLISFDYSTISKLVPFTPTAVDIRAEEMAGQAAQMLINLLEGNTLPQPQLLLSHQFIIGDSTAPPP